MGQNIFNGLVDAALKRNVSIRIVQQQPSPSMPDTDSQALMRMGAATVRSINWSTLMGTGILHTKFIIVDGKSFYVGSSNFDWRSLAQVKELGVVVANCPVLANDISKIFDQYWIMSFASSMPTQWPMQDYTMYNLSAPFTFNSKDRGPTGVFMAAAPPQMSISNWRTNDLDAILNAINSANQFVYFSVMDYAPTSLFVRPNFYWPLIDDALRAAAFQRNVTVRLLFSVWSQTKGSAYQWMRSLDDIRNINVRVMIIPRAYPRRYHHVSS
jgi:phospholipase D3/4